MQQFNKLYRMGAFALLVVLFSLVLPASAFAQEEEDKFSMTVTLNSDQFFGFYPFFSGSYAVNDKFDFTFYGILWSGGTGSAWGNWTEFGAGLKFNVAEGVTIAPQIGLLGGSLLSSGALGGGILGDGIVPNLTIALSREKTEGEFYLGYYTPLRDEAPEEGSTLAYLHYWANFGYKFGSLVSAGLHFEHLMLAGGSNIEESSDVYQWFGPYVQFADPKGRGWARFSSGTDFVEANDSFFKLTVGMNF